MLPFSASSNLTKIQGSVDGIVQQGGVCYLILLIGNTCNYDVWQKNALGQLFPVLYYYNIHCLPVNITEL